MVMLIAHKCHMEENAVNTSNISNLLGNHNTHVKLYFNLKIIHRAVYVAVQY